MPPDPPNLRKPMSTIILANEKYYYSPCPPPLSSVIVAFAPTPLTKILNESLVLHECCRHECNTLPR